MNKYIDIKYLNYVSKLVCFIIYKDVYLIIYS